MALVLYCLSIRPQWQTPVLSDEAAAQHENARLLDADWLDAEPEAQAGETEEADAEPEGESKKAKAEEEPWSNTNNSEPPVSWVIVSESDIHRPNT